MPEFPAECFFPPRLDDCVARVNKNTENSWKREGEGEETGADYFVEGREGGTFLDAFEGGRSDNSDNKYAGFTNYGLVGPVLKAARFRDEDFAHKFARSNTFEYRGRVATDRGPARPSAAWRVVVVRVCARKWERET